MITTLDARNLPQLHSGGSVVSIGVFDGVHLGHQAILRANLERSRELESRATVVTFRRHPKQVLLGHAPRTLTSLEHRLELFRREGVQHTLVLTFDEELRSIGAREFVDRLLIEGLGTRAFVLGFDSKFGKDKQGTPGWLRSLGHDVRVVDKVQIGERPVSSTAIREAVELGDLEGARRMLGREVSVLGTVVHGDGLGRRIGFPTANLDLHHELHPPPGVYAVRARILRDGPESPRGPDGKGDAARAAVANIGFRPTLGGAAPAEPRVEVHLLDFEGDLYGAHLEIEFFSHLRPEQRFDGLEPLEAAISADVAEARRLLD